MSSRNAEAPVLLLLQGNNAFSCARGGGWEGCGDKTPEESREVGKLVGEINVYIERR